MERGVADHVIATGSVTSPIIGRLVGKGLHDELTEEAYAVIDGTDGRAHHVRFRGVEAFEHASDFDLASQVTAPGSTWLDHRLVERQPMPLSMGGFGREVRDAIRARPEHLADVGFATRQGQRVVLQPDLLATLRRRGFLSKA